MHIRDRVGRIQERDIIACFKRWACICRSEEVPLRQKCARLVSQVCSVAPNGDVDWSWSQEPMNKVKGWETVMTRRAYPFRHGEDWHACRKVLANRQGFTGMG